MWGPEGLTRAVAANLSKHLPGRIALQRERWKATPQQIPDVQKIYPTPRDFVDIGGYPCIMLEVQNTEGRRDNRQIEIGAEYDEYTLLYKIRALVWTMETSKERAELLAQRLILCTREALLIDQAFGDDDSDEGGELDSRLLRESYADAVGSDGQFLSGGWVEVGIRAHERLDSPFASRLGAIIPVETDAYPPTHPSMEGEPI